MGVGPSRHISAGYNQMLGHARTPRVAGTAERMTTARLLVIILERRNAINGS